MISVSHSCSRIPDQISEEGNVGSICTVSILQEHGVRPFPSGKDQEELLEEDSRRCVWIELAGSGDKDGPSNTTIKSKNVGVDTMVLGPDLDGSESSDKVLTVRD